jgi:hypothetical protein
VFAVATLLLVPIVAWGLEDAPAAPPVTLWAGLMLIVRARCVWRWRRTDGWLVASNWLVGLVEVGCAPQRTARSLMYAGHEAGERWPWGEASALSHESNLFIILSGVAFSLGCSMLICR